jgi:uncharacterized protein YdaU (DUF1376 family)
MARTKPPSFDFFPDDFIAGTYHLPADAVGIYVRLLCYQWNNGSIPSDENELARVAGVDADAMRTHMRTVMLKFMPDGCGGLKNVRLEMERGHKLSVIEKSKSAADSRWTKEKARKAAESASRMGCGGDANAHADAHADAHAGALPTHMPPASNVLLPASIDIHSHTLPQDDPNGLIGQDVIVPNHLREWFIRWLDWRWQDSGKKPPATLQQIWVHDLLTRGQEKAILDLKFSIRKQGKNLLDSGNDFGKASSGKPNGGSSGPQGGRKLTAGEKTAKLLEDLKNGRT